LSFISIAHNIEYKKIGFNVIYILLQTLECIIGFYVIALGAWVRVWAYVFTFMLRSLG